MDKNDNNPESGQTTSEVKPYTFEEDVNTQKLADTS
jgi:hypothetical protein